MVESLRRSSAEARLAGITQELREQERVLTQRFDESEASWSSLHSTLQAGHHMVLSVSSVYVVVRLLGRLK